MIANMRSKQKGFSVIEVLIVLVLIGILIQMLAPVLGSYIVRSNRSDAIKSLSAMQIAQEKWRLNSTSYGTLAQIWTTGATNSLSKLYDMTVTVNTTNAYTLVANAPAGYAQNADDSCTTMTITYANGTSTQTPTTCWQ